MGCFDISILLVFYFLFFIYMASSFDRLLSCFQNNTITGGGCDMFLKAVDLMSGNILDFLFGFGGGEHSFHDFVIGLSVRLGFAATLIYLIVMLFIFFKML